MGVRRGSRFTAAAASAVVIGVVIAAVVWEGPPTVKHPQLADDEELLTPPPMPVVPAPAPVARVVPPPETRDAGDARALKARQVITQARAAYASCETYEDHGMHDTSFRSGTGWSEETEFHTVFAGPGAVRFAYRDGATEYLPDRFTQLVVDDAAVEEVMPWAGEPQRGSSLTGALAGLTGVSHGLAIAVLPLLPSGLDDLPSVLDVQNPEAIGTEDVDGEPCDLLSATRRGNHVRIWIAQTDSLIRRISEDTVVSAEDIRGMRASAEAALHEAGLPTIEEDFEERDAEGLSTFALTTFHPTCGQRIQPSALRLTDGSL